MTLVVLLPFLFYLNAALTWMVVACATLIILVLLAYLRPLRRVFARVVIAESEKAAALGETIFGVKTVKSLALEPQRKALWDARVADAGKWRLAFGTRANWPQTIVNPIERFMSIGIVLTGAYIALADASGYAVGALFAFMMLSMRVAQPLAGLARLIENCEEVGAAISQAASVLNRPLEPDSARDFPAPLPSKTSASRIPARRAPRSTTSPSRCRPAPCSASSGAAGPASRR
jgi:ATP-binding cassette subfamily B protein